MFDFGIFARPESWLSLLTLSAMEIVLGIDNIVFISILTSRLPKEQEAKARRLGLILALVMRLGLLFAITWVLGLTRPLFTVLGNELSGRDLILLGGGLFLVAKSSHEMFAKLEAEHAPDASRGGVSMTSVIVQVLILDVVFSLDSVITAVGMAREILIMIIAMVIAVGVMLIFAGPISRFVNKHPSMKVLALSFLVLIGVVLIADGLGQHINKGYIYFAMAFALVVQLVEMKVVKRKVPVKLHDRMDTAPPSPEPAPPA